ncbi:MAG: hypothetical protein BJ554DRAFT_1367 [Olpidium bornovanus]|uniref:Uncharacterized protein n=1 Tax=Olpidium bornovanus TaxID=278681 RepID=A0A8H8DH48_9FUNG|nr:MAG: hypothetical protein BJ554DRAFT_1367 [Olpidium bornovanus]
MATMATMVRPRCPVCSPPYTLLSSPSAPLPKPWRVCVKTSPGGWTRLRAPCMRPASHVYKRSWGSPRQRPNNFGHRCRIAFFDQRQQCIVL